MCKSEDHCLSDFQPCGDLCKNDVISTWQSIITLWKRTCGMSWCVIRCLQRMTQRALCVDGMTTDSSTPLGSGLTLHVLRIISQWRPAGNLGISRLGSLRSTNSLGKLHGSNLIQTTQLQYRCTWINFINDKSVNAVLCMCCKFYIRSWESVQH